MQKFTKLFFNKQFFKFILVGGINTLGGTLYAYLISLFLQENAAFIMGYSVSLVVAYLLNSAFVFIEKLSFVQFIKFCLSYIPNFVIQNLVVFFMFNVMSWHKLIAYFGAAVIGLPITFLVLKLLTFRKKK